MLLAAGANVKELKPVASDSGAETEPAVTRDGQFLYYTFTRKGSRCGDIVRQRVGSQSGDALVQITATSEHEYSPTAMPSMGDITSVLCCRRDCEDSDAEGSLYKCTSQGLCTRILHILKSGSPPRVAGVSASPDGSQFAFETAEAFVEARYLYRSPESIFGRKILVRPTEPTGENLFIASGSYPAWSWDGRKLAYTKRDGDRAMLCVYNFDTLQESIVTRGPEAFDIMPTWSPDGEWLVFSRLIKRERGDDYDLWMVCSDGNGGTRPLVYGRGTDEINPVIAFGGVVYFQTSFTMSLPEDENWDIWSAEVQF